MCKRAARPGPGSGPGWPGQLRARPGPTLPFSGPGWLVCCIDGLGPGLCAFFVPGQPGRTAALACPCHLRNDGASSSSIAEEGRPEGAPAADVDPQGEGERWRSGIEPLRGGIEGRNCFPRRSRAASASRSPPHSKRRGGPTEEGGAAPSRRRRNMRRRAAA